MPNRTLTFSFLLLCALTSFAQVTGAPPTTSRAWQDLEAGVASVKASADVDAALPRVAAASDALSGDPVLGEGARSLKTASENALRAWKAPNHDGYEDALKALLSAYASMRGTIAQGRAAAQAAGRIPDLPVLKDDGEVPVSEQIDAMFGENARGDAGGVGAGTVTDTKGGGTRGPTDALTTAVPVRRALDDSKIGALPGDAPAGPDPLAAARGELSRLQTMEAVLEALPAAPLLGPICARPLADARTGRALLEASLSSRDWLERNAAELGASNASARVKREAELAALGFSPADARVQADRELGSPAALQAELERALALPADKRAPALAALQGRLDAAFASSAAAEDEDVLRRRMMMASTADEAAAAALELHEFGRSEREYLQARGAWAQFVAASREKLALAPDGTAFTQEALGVDLAATGPMTKSSRYGAPGIEYRAADGLRRFEALDGRVSGLEVRGAKGSVFIVTDRREGRLVITTYDDENRKLDAERYEPQPDGRFAWSLDSAPWPRALGRMDPAGRFSADEYRNEDGSSRVAVGAAMPGAWLLKDKSGAVAGRTLDLAALAGEKDRAARATKAAAVARWFAEQVRPGDSGEPLRFRQSVTSLLEDYLAHGRGASTFFMGADGQITITEEIPGGGVSQLVAKMEDSVSGRDTRGLKVYLRRGGGAGAAHPNAPPQED